MKRIATALAGLFLAAIVIIGILPSGSSQARWTDSTTLTRAEFTTTSSAPQPPAEETPTDPAPPVIETDNPRHGSNTEPGFTITAGDEDIVFDLATLKRGAVKHGSGPNSLPNQVEITVWIAPDSGPDTCTALRTGAAEDAVQVSDAIRHSKLNGGKTYAFKPSAVNIPAGETYVVCPIVTIDGGDDFSKFPGSSFELIFKYSIAADSGPINGSVTTVFEVDDNNRRTGESSRARTMTDNNPSVRDDSENQNVTEGHNDSADQNDSEAPEDSVNGTADDVELAGETGLDQGTQGTDSDSATGRGGETP